MTIDDLLSIKERLLQKYPVGSEHIVVVHDITEYGDYNDIKIHGDLPLELEGKEVVNICYPPFSPGGFFPGPKIVVGSMHRITILKADINKKYDVLQLYFRAPFDDESLIHYEKKPSK